MIKQTGFLYELRPTDFITGSSPISAEEINPSGDWSDYLPKGEKQYKYATFDTMSCTTFSFLNAIETAVKFLRAKGYFTQEQIQTMNSIGFNADGEFNCSDRFTAIMSKTMPQGNYFQNVGDSVRKDGLLPEALLMFGGNSWNQYHDATVITEEMKKTAKKILDILEINYEWTSVNISDIQNGLKQCPIQAAIPIPSTHAVMIPVNGYYFDSYKPFIKPLVQVHYAMKVIVKVKKPVKTWKYFKLTEKTGSFGHTIADLKPELVDLMDKMRGECGFPWIITSGYRTITENNSLPNSAKDSAHTTREAVDIYCVDDRRRQIIIDVIRKNGINRYGIGKNFIHIDISKTLTQNVTWNY